MQILEASETMQQAIDAAQMIKTRQAATAWFVVIDNRPRLNYWESEAKQIVTLSAQQERPALERIEFNEQGPSSCILIYSRGQTEAIDRESFETAINW